MDNLVTISNLSVVFNKDKKIIDNISFDIPKGKTVALVGESGSGKTITALSILKLLPSAATNADGEIIYNRSLIHLRRCRRYAVGGARGAPGP